MFCVGNRKIVHRALWTGKEKMAVDVVCHVLEPEKLCLGFCM